MNKSFPSVLTVFALAHLSACSKTTAKPPQSPYSPVAPAEQLYGGDVNAPNPDQVQIRSISYAGSGCPAATVASNISPDAKALTILFQEYLAEVGPNIAASAGRKNCQLTVDMNIPAGHTYTLVSLDTRGFAKLEPGVTGTVKSTFYFQGQQISDAFSQTITGPSADDYIAHASAAFKTDTWSPCDSEPRALNINTEILVSNTAAPTAAGFMTVESVDSEWSHQYGIKWDTCKTPGDPLASRRLIVVGPGAGSSEPVRVFDTRHTDKAIAEFRPFGSSYTGGYHVALADINGDGVMDLIAGTETNQAPRVVVIDGKTRQIMADFAPFGGHGGVYVAAGDTNGDGKAEVIAAAGSGVAPEVKVFNQASVMIRSVMVYEPTHLGGVRVAMGDFDGDGIVDIATSTPPGGGPRVRILNGRDLSTISDGFVYEPEFRGGVWIAAGDVDGDGKAELITGADAGGGPRVRILNAKTYVAKNDFFAYDAQLRTGVRVAAVDADGDGKAELIVGPGIGGGPHIRVLNAITGADSGPGSFWGADPTSRAGFYVSGAVESKLP